MRSWPGFVSGVVLLWGCDAGELDPTTEPDAETAAFADAGAEQDASATCYSPIRLPDADVWTGQGCACDLPEASGYCIRDRGRDHAIICAGGRWVAGLDGPCEPNTRTREQCVAAGARAIDDPGDGSSYRNGCAPGEYQLSALELGVEGGICCKALLVSPAACAQAGYRTLSDPGNGSLLRAGCPEGAVLRAYISGFDEGGLCCEPRAQP